MDLIKLVSNAAPTVNESTTGGAVGGGAVAAVSTPLFASLVKRSMSMTPTMSPYATKTKKTKKTKKRRIGLKETFDDMSGASGDANTTPQAAYRSKADDAGVVSKLKDLEHKEKDSFRDTVTFGLEDENGGLVRVVVKQEQAPQFEEALQAHMSKDDDDDDRPMEIGEILFKLKDQFDIVDVVWPTVEEDEEEDVSMGDPQLGANPGDVGANSGELGANPEDMGGDMPPLGDAGSEDQTVSMLTQVLDMMKADAEARKADAEARKAEAKAKEADAVILQAQSKVKQEEQYLDMEAYNKAKKEEDRETKRLAQLAKWKHDVEREGGDVGPDDSGFDDEPSQLPPMGNGASPEEEERAYIRPAPKQHAPRKATTGARVSPSEVANFILNRAKR